MEVLNDNAVSIVSGDDDSTPANAVVGVAAESGSGRILGLGHDGFFINGALDLYSNRQFGINIIDWLQSSQSNKKVLVTTGHGEPWVGSGDYDDFYSALQSRGYAVTKSSETISESLLSDVSVLFINCPGPSLSDSEINAIRSFVSNGGGLFMQGLGWSWVSYQNSLLEENPVNKIGMAYGMKWIDGYIGDPTNNYNGCPIFHLFNSGGDDETGSKYFKIWVGDKDSLNLAGAEVYVDGSYAGTTDSRGEVRTIIAFGTHTISAEASCGSASKDYEFSEDIDGATLYINTCPDGTPGSKSFKIWVGDKNSLNLAGADVYVDGIYAGTTDSRGEVRTIIAFGTHTISAEASCGSASKDYEFSEHIDGVTLYIDTCPADCGDLADGGIYHLKCLGDIEGNRWLDGRTQDGSVGLAPTTEGFYTGTKWQAIEVEPCIYHFKCLGDIEGNRWLDGRTQDGSVGLAPTTEGFYTGTKWQPIEVEPGIYHFKCMGDIEGNRWLDGRTQDGSVGLAPTTEGFYTGTKWQVIGTGDDETVSKSFKIWVGDKNSLNLAGAEVYVDGIYSGTTDSRGEVITTIAFGTHTISAEASCGSASKDYEFSEDIDGATLYINTCPADTEGTFKIWVGDKNSLNLAGADVYVDGTHVGTTDSRGEVLATISYGSHTISAEAPCGSASKVYEFSNSIDGVSLYINTCPADTEGTFKIWVGDKNSLNLAGADVYVDGTHVGTTDSRGEVLATISYGSHTISAEAPCGSASKVYEFSNSIDGVSLYINTCPADTSGSKSFKIWVGDKNSLNLAGADVYVDGSYVGTTDDRGEVWAVITFGTHIVSAVASCGSASKEYAFSNEIAGATIYISTC
jgi:hypothetical protein